MHKSTTKWVPGKSKTTGLPLFGVFQPHRDQKLQQTKSVTSIQLSNAAFERKYKFDPTKERYVRKLFTDEILREMVSS